MKTVQIVVYSCKTEEVLSVGDLLLPSKEFDEQHQTGHEAANEVLESLGMECAIWCPILKNDKVEMWQALMVSGTENEELLNTKHEWIAVDFVDCGTDGSWFKKIIRKNLPEVIADSLVGKFKEREESAAEIDV